MTRSIRTITMHCSDSDNPIHDDFDIIKKWHTSPPPKGRGWSNIGYHYLILKNGYIHDGRPLNVIPASAKGHNKDTIAICLTGREIFSKKQFDSAVLLCRTFLTAYAIPIDSIFPHNHFNPDKTCPNFDINLIRARL